MKRTILLIGMFIVVFAVTLLAINKSSTKEEKMTQSETPEIMQDISSLEQLPESTLPVMKIKGGNSEVYLQSLDI